MLSTNLARGSGTRVVSAARIYELLRQFGDATHGAVVQAARDPGATEPVDGTLVRIGADHLRLELRRVDLATGGIRRALRVEGRDIFALIDRGPAHLLVNYGSAARPARCPTSPPDRRSPTGSTFWGFSDSIRAISSAPLFDTAPQEDS